MLDRKALRPILIALAGAVFCGALAAQSFDLGTQGRPILGLGGLMRFHPGDDPTLGWSNPALDDSSWPLIRGDQPWYAQGYPLLTGFAWYRFKVTLPARPGPLAIWVPAVATNFQVFVNGRLIASLGSISPHPVPFSGEDLAFTIPPDLAQAGQPLNFAVRVWYYPSEWEGGQAGGIQEPMQLGDASLIHEWQTHRLRQIFWENAQYNVDGLVCLLAGLGSVLLFFLRRSDREFLWFGLFEVINVLYVFPQSYFQLHSTSITLWLWFQAVLILGLNITMPTMIRHFGRIGRTRLYWLAIAIALSDFLLNGLSALDWISPSTFSEVGAVCKLLLAASNCALLFQASKDDKMQMRIFSIPIAVYFINLTAVYVSAVFVERGATWMIRYQSLFFSGLTDWPFPLGTFQITSVAVQLALFAIFLLRFVRTRSDEERYKNELEAARAVQQVLVPEEIPTVPGFELDSVYKPAGQVGGDFFQIIPTPNGGVLVAIGDVSGKGMPAAMTVSLLVGTLRTLAHFTQSPAEILGAMNQRMLSRSSGGFTTCLVLAVSAKGTLTAANAGHIAPYLNSRELTLCNGLPLGLSASEHYEESVFTVAAGEQLTLMTDGVVEARAPSGELLGFERVKTMIAESASSIVRAAQLFGQDDDITVLTLRFTPAQVVKT